MNEISDALRVVKAALKTVRVIDFAKKAVIVSAAATCCVFVFKLYRNR